MPKSRKTLGSRIAGALVSHFFAENQPELERLAHVVAHTAHVAKKKLAEVRAEEEPEVDAKTRMKVRNEKRQARRHKKEESSEPISLVKGEDGVWRQS